MRRHDGLKPGGDISKIARRGRGTDSIFGDGAAEGSSQVGQGNDTLKGNAGNDTFIFAAGFDLDTISGFKAGAGSEDAIRFSQSVFADFAAVLAASTQSGSDVLTTASANDVITLKTWRSRIARR